MKMLMQIQIKLMDIKLKYTQWVNAKIKALGFDVTQKYIPELFGLCVDVAEEMEKAFPELKVTGGFAITSKADVDRVYKKTHPLYEELKIHHTWLVTPSGDIIDPTIKQFREISRYQKD